MAVLVRVAFVLYDRSTFRYMKCDNSFGQQYLSQVNISTSPIIFNIQPEGWKTSLPSFSLRCGTFLDHLVIVLNT